MAKKKGNYQANNNKIQKLIEENKRLSFQNVERGKRMGGLYRIIQKLLTTLNTEITFETMEDLKTQNVCFATNILISQKEDQL